MIAEKIQEITGEDSVMRIAVAEKFRKTAETDPARAIEEIYPNTDIIMEIPDTDCAKALKKAEEIAESCTEGFGSSVTRRLLTALLYVRFSKDSSIEEKSFVEALRLDTSNLIIDCRKDNGKKWSGMNTLLKCLFGKLG